MQKARFFKLLRVGPLRIGISHSSARSSLRIFEARTIPQNETCFTAVMNSIGQLLAQFAGVLHLLFAERAVLLPAKLDARNWTLAMKTSFASVATWKRLNMPVLAVPKRALPSHD